MRIIGGKWKGKRIEPPRNITARPTTDMAKESLFNILEGRVEWDEISALDLFGGTGAIGYEMASRGCGHVVMLEKDERHAAFIRGMIDNLGMKEQIRLLKGDALRYIAAGSEAFDVVFADPPYAMKELPELPERVLGSGRVKPGGMFILEHPKSFDFSDRAGFVEHRKYGNVNFTFFAPAED